MTIESKKATTRVSSRLPWQSETRSGRVPDFIEAYGHLPVDQFLKCFTCPFITTPFSVDPGSWENAVVLRVESEKPQASRVSLGRDHSNDLQIYHGSVSKTHGYFSFDGTKWCITDQGSSNGTLIDGVPIPPNTPIRITRDVERIELGDVVLTFMSTRAMGELLESIRKSRGP